MDTYIYDLHSGRFDDLEFAIKALTKTPLETEKIVIVITSVLTWGMTPPKMVEDIPEPSPEEEKAADEAPNPDQENNVNNPKNEENKDKEIPEAKEENEDESEESNEKSKIEKSQTDNGDNSNVNNEEGNNENNLIINEEELKKQRELEMLAKIPKKKVFFK